MKRSYPYAGAANAQAPASGSHSATQPQSTVDYSAYGYGNTAQMSSAHSGGNDAQQAQWHQQWQQYYAQQASAAAATQSGNPGASARSAASPPLVGAQPYGYGATPSSGPSSFPQQPFQQQQMQMQASSYYQGYTPQHPQSGSPASAYTGWSGPSAGGVAPTAPHPTGQSYPSPYSASMSPQQPIGSQDYYGSSPSNKRPRLDGAYGSQARPPPYPAQQTPPLTVPTVVGSGWQQQQQQRIAGGPARATATHPIPGRPQVSPLNGNKTAVHPGGPSHMAAPMAASVPRGSGVPPRPLGAGGRSSRGQQRHLSSAGGGGGHFAGPQGVNAVSPLTGPVRSNFGQQQRNHGNRRGNQHAGRTAHQSSNLGANDVASSGSSANSKSVRQQNDTSRIGKSSIPKGPAAAKNAVESGLEMHKAPLLQGRTSTPIDQPVPVTAKRTFTDFKVTSIDIEPIQWQWQREDDDSLVMKPEGDASLDESQSTDANAQRNGEDVVTEQKDGDKEGDGKQVKNTLKASSRRRSDASKDASRIRISFAANAPPANAPTGPKALVKTSEAKTQTKQDGDEGNDSAIAESSDSNAEKVHEQTSEFADGISDEVEWTAFSRGPPQTSTNRITITYAAMRRRLVIDSEAVKSTEINRAQGTIRITVEVKTAAGLKRKDQLDKKRGEEWVIVKGVLLEMRNGESANFSAVSRRELESCWREEKISIPNEKDGEREEVNKGHTTNERSDEATDREAAVETKAEPDLALASQGSEVEDAEPELRMEVKEEIDEEKNVVALRENGGSHEESASGERKDDAAVAPDDYRSLPPFYRLLSHHDGPARDSHHEAQEATEMTILLSVEDTTQQAKWLRTGDLEEWLAALPGVQASLSAEPLRAWVSKFHVVDPDPPPTLTDVYDEWVKRSTISTALHRRQFVHESHLTSVKGLSDVFARLVNVQSNGAATPDRPSSSTTTPQSRELGPPLQSRLSETQFDAHQSHVSLSILALVEMVREYAGPAGVSEEQLSARLQSLVLCIPLNLLFRSLDGLCKEMLDKQRIAQAKSRRNQSSNGNRPTLALPANSRSVGVGSTASSVGGDEDDTSIVSASRAGSATPSQGGTMVVKDEDRLNQRQGDGKEQGKEERDWIEAGTFVADDEQSIPNVMIDTGSGEGEGEMMASSSSSSSSSSKDMEIAPTSFGDETEASLKEKVDGRTSEKTSDPTTSAGSGIDVEIDSFLRSCDRDQAGTVGESVQPEVALPGDADDFKVDE